LFAASGDFGGELGVNEGVEFVENGDDAVLFREGGKRDFDLSNLT
jgi:hypothetical protein